MNSKEFYKKINDNVKKLNREELIIFLNNIIRKIPESKYKEVVQIFSTSNGTEKSESISSIIKEYKEKFDLIDNGELYFHARGYEEYGEYYSPWGGDWIWEYSDEENVGDLIYEASLFAVELVNRRNYHESKELIDMIIYTNYQVLDDDGGDIFEISLQEIQSQGLAHIKVDTIFLYAIYTTYQNTTGTQRASEIYKYFQNRDFYNIKVEDSFNLGTEVLEELEQFWDNWINLLVNHNGKIESRLLIDAFEYTTYDKYKKYIKELSRNHPKLFIDIFNTLSENNKIDEIVSIGNEVLSIIDKNVVARNEIALYVAQYDNSNKEKYIIEAFKSSPNVPNLIRIINNGYYQKHKDTIEEISKVENDTKYFIKFFLGQFDEFYEKCREYKSPLGWTGSFIETAVYLWILTLNNTKSKINENIISEIFERLGFKNNILFLDDDYYLILTKWKGTVDINNVKKYIDWLIDIIDKRVEGILNGKYRNSYFKAARLIVALSEVLEANNIISKDEYIKEYHQKYSRHSSFRAELNKYSKQIEE